MAHRLWLLSNADVPPEDPLTWTVGFMPIVPLAVKDLLAPSVIFTISLANGEVVGLWHNDLGFGRVAVTRT